jgi:hypothetical protein
MVSVPVLMDIVLREVVDQAYEVARLGRNGIHTTRSLVSAEMLAGLEAGGHAMHLVVANGRIAWRATPNLCQYLTDLELDPPGRYGGFLAMLGRRSTSVPFSADALKASLLRLENEWEKAQASHDRAAIYGYLTAIFELVEWWNLEGRAIKRARWAFPSTRAPLDKKAGTVRRRDPLPARSRQSRCQDAEQVVAGAAVRRQNTRT